jgi:hypothetical protein
MRDLRARLFRAHGKTGIALATTLTIPANAGLVIEVYQCQRIVRAGGDTIATGIAQSYGMWVMAVFALIVAALQE